MAAERTKQLIEMYPLIFGGFGKEIAAIYAYAFNRETRHPPTHNDVLKIRNICESIPIGTENLKNATIHIQWKQYLNAAIHLAIVLEKVRLFEMKTITLPSKE